MSRIYEGTRQANLFRQEMGFGEKIVVTYSGNMAVVHPLNTFLGTAAALKDDNRFLFVFIGGGLRKKDVEQFKNKHNLENIRLLPLQPREYIHVSLGSADLQVVIHGNGCTGYTHPSKIYGGTSIGRPILYIGPKPSHVTDILDECPWNISVLHGEVDQLVDELRRFAELGQESWERMGKKNRECALLHFTRSLLCGRLIQEIEGILPRQSVN
jgi:glycosyltransferase involved in cell wall biosynthesis